jgi:hypothetical protein
VINANILSDNILETNVKADRTRPTYLLSVNLKVVGLEVQGLESAMMCTQKERDEWTKDQRSLKIKQSFRTSCVVGD